MIFNPLKVEELNTIRTKKAITYYVNASTGSDTNNGLSASTAFKTIQHAIDIAPKWLDHNVSIRLAVGTYDRVNISGFCGRGVLTIIGSDNWNQAPAMLEESVNYIVKGIYVNNCPVRVVLQGIMGTPGVNMSEVGNTAFAVEGISYMQCQWCRATGTSENASGECGYNVKHRGMLYMQYCRAENLERGISCDMNGRAFAAGMQGSGVAKGYIASDGGILHEGHSWGVSVGYTCATKYVRERSGLLIKSDGTLAT